MKIGVKFCGGCNPKYNRSQFLKDICSQIEYEISYAKENENYNLLLVINGCTSMCCSVDQLKYDASIWINALSSLEVITRKILEKGDENNVAESL